MDITLDFVRENINWLKDIFTIIFTGVATTIAILTYKRAKETFLQPVRTEVIKKQTELLADLLEILYEDDPDSGLDYVGVVRVNVFEWLVSYGFILNNQEEIKKSILKEMDSLFLVLPGKQTLEEFELISSFKEKENKKGLDDYGKKLYEKGKSGKIIINKIFFTKKHISYVNKLYYYAENPFIPSNIKISLEALLQDINVNLSKNLKKVIERFIREVFSKKVKTGFSPNGVFNEFNHIRIHHKQNYEMLKKEIRSYLKVDSMP